MPNATSDDVFDAFIAAGNAIVGPRPNVDDAFSTVWKGAGSVLEFASGVTLSATRIAFASGGGRITLQDNVQIKGRPEVSGGGHITIGRDTFINRASDIRAGEGAEVTIGERCLFANIKIYTSDMHAILDAKTGKRTNPAAGVAIEDDVWLAEDVKVAKGVRIGSGAIVASGSLVTRSVAPLCMAAGRPARVVRTCVRWSRSIGVMPALPAPKFAAGDIPFDKEVLRLMVARGAFALVEAVIAAQGDAPLPLFARWYQVLVRHKLGRPSDGAIAVLDQIILEQPAHAAAAKLRETILQG